MTSMGENVSAADGAGKRRTLPTALEPYKFKPGQSGNPGGKGGAYQEVMRLSAEASPRAMQRMIELIESKDDRVALVASEKVIERRYGKPKESTDEPGDDGPRIDLSKLTDKQLRQVRSVMALLMTAAVRDVVDNPDE